MKNPKDKTIIHYCIAVLFFVMAPAFGAEMKPWDGQQALSLAEDLYSASRDLNKECRQSPKYGLDSTGPNSHLEFRYHVKHFVSVTRQLVEALENGESRAETQPIYDESVQIINDLNRYAGGENPIAWPLVVNATSKAGKNLT